MVAKPRRKKSRKLAKLFENKGQPLTAQETDEIRPAFEGRFGDFTSEVFQAGRDADDGIYVLGRIKNADGAQVGMFSRILQPTPDGEVTAVHKVLTLKPAVQGHGIATMLNRKAMDWYRDNGVTQVQLNANIDIGGVAWARAGYDWQAEDDPGKIARRMDEVQRLAAGGEVDPDSEEFLYPPEIDRIPADRREEQLELARQMRARLEQESFGEDDYPTPFEVSDLGRWEGAGRDDWWIGRVIMTGSDWNGVTEP